MSNELKKEDLTAHHWSPESEGFENFCWVNHPIAGFPILYQVYGSSGVGENH